MSLRLPVSLHKIVGRSLARGWRALAVLGLVLSACTSAPAAALPAVRGEPSPTASLTAAGAAQQPAATPTTAPPTLTPTEPAPAQVIGLPDTLPSALAAALELPEGWSAVRGPADITLDVAEPGAPAGVDWFYALAAPFATVQDDITSEALRAAWNRRAAASGQANEGTSVLLVDPSTRAVFEKAWGPPGAHVREVATTQILDAAWREKNAWAILPFEALEPRWKVLAVNGTSPIRKDFDPAGYPLRVRFAPQGSLDRITALQAAVGEGAPLALSNRQPDQLTTVMLTGVTALVRGTASLMEVLGMPYPASDIGPWLREADILHISNEVPFARNCPQPFDWKDLVFCSQTEYIQLLEDVGADVIELTGDHFADWGPEAMLYTVSLYNERGWPYYGGGENLADAQRPVTLEHNGNKIAFLGCNGKEPGYATASATAPGAAHCDFTVMAAELKDLRAQGYNPIFTFQHLEYYQYIALPPLQTDFHTVADAGAVIVSGSQAHQPHAFEYRGESFLHYGLGNLFFDQTNQGEPPRTAFIDRHVFYGNRHISTELLTIYFVDYARARPMTPTERRALLETVFQASGWETNQSIQP